MNLRSRFFLYSVVFLLPTVTHAGDKSMYLGEKVDVGTQSANKLDLEIRGTMTVDNDKKESLAARAILEYPERVLSLGNDKRAKKVIRYYSDARAKIVVGNSEEARKLRNGLRLQVGDREEKLLSLWSPVAPMTGDERELIEQVFDTTCLPGLLPNRVVKVGETWEVDASAVQGLCGLESANASDVNIKCTLEKIDRNEATIRCFGTAEGVCEGCQVKAKVDATLTFDDTSKTIVAGVWKETDDRSASAINPAGTQEITIQITRSATASAMFADDQLKNVNTTPNAASKLLLFEDVNKRFRFFYDRKWHLNVQKPESSILRRIDDGVFVCQLSITPLSDGAAGTTLSTKDFQAAVESSGGFKIEEIVKTEMIPTDGTCNLQMIQGTGKTSDNIALTQRHYLAASPSGKQVVFSFLFEPRFENKSTEPTPPGQQPQPYLGKADLELVTTMEYIAPAQTAGKDTKDAKNIK